MHAENAQFRPSCAFAPLVFSLTGSGLICAWLCAVEAGLRSYAIAAVPGLILTILSILRRPRPNPNSAGTGTDPTEETGRMSVSGAVFLFGCGAMLGLLVLSAWLIPFAAVALAYLFVPWSRLSLGRQHAGWSSIAMTAGCLSVVAAGHRQVDVMFLLLASWILWTCACCALLLQIHRQRNTMRNARARREAPATERRQVTAQG